MLMLYKHDFYNKFKNYTFIIIINKIVIIKNIKYNSNLNHPIDNNGNQIYRKLPNRMN